MEIGEMIKKRRLYLKMTQEELANKINVSRSTISNWEIGRNYPDIKMILSLSNHLNISLDYLLKGDEIIVDKITQDTIVRKEQSKKIKMLYVAISLLVLIAISITTVNYLSVHAHTIKANQIESIDLDDNMLNVTFNLPAYESYGGYSTAILPNENTIEIEFLSSTDLSMRNTKQTEINLKEELNFDRYDEQNKDLYEHINKIKIVGKDGDILKEIDFKNIASTNNYHQFII